MGDVWRRGREDAVAATLGLHATDAAVGTTLGPRAAEGEAGDAGEAGEPAASSPAASCSQAPAP